MQVVHECCAGFDVHKKTVMACVRRMLEKGRIERQVREFGTMTADILALGDWLSGLGVTHVAMESTGVFWKPIWNLLEGSFEILLCNAQHIKQVPGRKTDVKDCEWIAQLLQHGLLRGSFVPPTPIRELRDLTRHRAKLVGDRSSVVNRIHKTLEDANIKLGAVASDILGVSGRAMINAIVQGEEDSEKLAELALRRLRGKIPDLRLALQGRVRDHHRFLLKALLDHLEFLDSQIARLDDRIDEVARPFQEAVQRLTTIPGVQKRTAENLIAEIGPNMEHFPSAAHLASWGGLCPGNNESAGKRKSGRTRKGNVWLRAALIESAHSLGRGRGTYLAAQYRRLTARRGKKKAAVAIGHSILIIVYNLL